MIKRLGWFLGGAVAGVAGVGVAKRKVKAAAVELAPANVARKASERVKDAVHEGVRAMRAKERELRARLDGEVHTLADDVGDDDLVMVDGVPVEPGQVIVLKQVRDRPPTGRRRRRA